MLRNSSQPSNQGSNPCSATSALIHGVKSGRRLTSAIWQKRAPRPGGNLACACRSGDMALTLHQDQAQNSWCLDLLLRLSRLNDSVVPAQCLPAAVTRTSTSTISKEVSSERPDRAATETDVARGENGEHTSPATTTAPFMVNPRRVRHVTVCPPRARSDARPQAGVRNASLLQALGEPVPSGDERSSSSALINRPGQAVLPLEAFSITLCESGAPRGPGAV